MDRLSALNRKSKARQTALIHKLPSDILHLIFICLLPSPDSVISATAEASASDLFNTTAPYNISRVCCSWREFALSSASLWSGFYLSFSDPSDPTLQQAVSFISLHLQRSQNLSLTFAVSLRDVRSATVTRNCKSSICKHQRHWRSVKLWFDHDVTSHGRGVVGGIPVIGLYLATKDLNQLEDLTINYAGEYHISATSSSDIFGVPKPDVPLPSLVHLSLETEDATGLAQCLMIAPNVKVLNLTFYSDYQGSFQLPLDCSFRIAPLHILNPGLQAIRIDRRLHRQWDSAELTSASKASAFVLRYLNCPALAELQLHLDGNTCILFLHDFFIRSAPPLQKLYLHVVDRPSGDDGQTNLLNRIIDTLTLLPTLLEFRLASRSLDDIGPVLLALTGRPGAGSNYNTSSTLLPILEHLEFHSMCAQPSLFIDLISSRWRAHGRTLKTVTLAQCSARRYGSRFPTFSPGGDSSRFPEAWAAVKEFISEGLRFEVR